MRPLPTAAIAAACTCSLAVAACGGSGDNGPRRSVHLSMDRPGDGAVVRSDQVRLTGRVVPAAAAVTVRGQQVAVSNGHFSARVPVDAGGNVIDVMATAADRAPAMTAVRVVRQLTVRVPDIGGDSPDGARARLAEVGLRADLHTSGGLIDDLLPGSRTVCGTDPGPGEVVDRGSTVSVEVSKVC